MKRIVIALLVLMTIFSLANAQKQTTVINDSTGNVKVTVTKDKDAKTNAGNTAVTVVGMDDEDADTTHVSTSKASTPRGPHGKASISIVSDDDDFPFNNFGNAVGGGILVAIISIIAIFGMPVFIIFVVFFFRYKNRKARYRLAEQALAAGQPLPEGFIRESKPTDQRTQGIRNTFTGIGLFIFLWAITGEFGIGAIGLLVMFMGIGQWLVGYKQPRVHLPDLIHRQREKRQEHRNRQFQHSLHRRKKRSCQYRVRVRHREERNKNPGEKRRREERRK